MTEDISATYDLLAAYGYEDGYNYSVPQYVGGEDETDNDTHLLDFTARLAEFTTKLNYAINKKNIRPNNVQVLSYSESDTDDETDEKGKSETDEDTAEKEETAESAAERKTDEINILNYLEAQDSTYDYDIFGGDMAEIESENVPFDEFQSDNSIVQYTVEL